jgi:hypothetical protein
MATLVAQAPKYTNVEQELRAEGFFPLMNLHWICTTVQGPVCVAQQTRAYRLDWACVMPAAKNAK